MNSNEIFILIGVFGLGFFLGSGVVDKKETVKVEQIVTDEFLTTDDLTAIYACVDQKIKNQNSEIKFPCVSVRGDSF